MTGRWPKRGSLRMRRVAALPNAELTVFPNSSHTPFYEEPEAYAKVLMKFLNAHRS